MNNKEMFSIPIEKLPIPFLLTDLKGKIFFTNKKALNLLGYKTSSEIKKKNLFDLIPHHEKADFIHIYQSFFKNKTKNPIYIRVIKKTRTL